MARKRRAPREIEASRITLRDADGNTRIMLDAGGSDGYAWIQITSKDGHDSMEVGTQPSGAVVMSFSNPDLSGMLTISSEGICLRAQDGLLGVTIGRVFDGADVVTVFENGQPVWQSPTPKRRDRPLGEIEYLKPKCQVVERQSPKAKKRGGPPRA